MTRLSQLGELGLLELLEERGLITGVANDAAELRDGLVVTQDALVDRVHFRLDWIGWRDLGRRAAAVNLSDLAASGARPEALLVTLAAPPATSANDIVALYEGLGEAGVPVVGGDTSASATLVISVTALGRSDRVPGRSGARPGDALLVTGPLGGAGAAFRERSYRTPPNRVEEGVALARVAHALMDSSDGLAVDLAHIARRSGVRCVVELADVPLAPGATVDDLGFGEDYELLAAVPAAAAPEAVVAAVPGAAVIGRVEAGEGVSLLLHGEPVSLAGWQHFSGEDQSVLRG